MTQHIPWHTAFRSPKFASPRTGKRSDPFRTSNCKVGPFTALRPFQACTPPHHGAHRNTIVLSKTPDSCPRNQSNPLQKPVQLQPNPAETGLEPGQMPLWKRVKSPVNPKESGHVPPRNQPNSPLETRYMCPKALLAPVHLWLSDCGSCSI